MILCLNFEQKINLNLIEKQSQSNKVTVKLCLNINMIQIVNYGKLIYVDLSRNLFHLRFQ